MKFVRKDFVVEAEKWFPHKDIEGISFRERYQYPFNENDPGIFCQIPCAYLETANGTQIVSPGNWIVTTSDGNKFAYHPYLFEKYFEKMEDKVYVYNNLVTECNEQNNFPSFSITYSENKSEDPIIGKDEKDNFLFVSVCGVLIERISKT